MARGERTLYRNIAPLKKRNTGIEARRDQMAYRYYFHANINRYLYQDCLHNLELEFNLSTNTIIKELLLRSELIKQLGMTNTTIAELRKHYPFYNWVSPRI